MNIKKIIAGAGATAILLGNVAMPAFAATFANGSFESGNAPGAFLVVNNGATDIDSWNVTSGSVDYIGTYWTAADGTRSIDLSGNEAGTISQTFDTVIGATYTVSFDLSGNPAGGLDEKTLNVSATGGATSPYSYNIATETNSLSDMKWKPMEYEFVATSNSSVLTFASTTAGFFGPAVDNIEIVEDLSTVPTPTPTGPEIPEQCAQDVEYNVIEGTGASEVINGTSGPDLIFARGGSDVVNGGNGNDCIVGGAGSDVLHGNNHNDVILGGEGSDSINGHNGNDKLYGQDGSDSVMGGSGNDQLFGGAESDYLNGGGNTDTATGNAGSDACTAETEVSCEA